MSANGDSALRRGAAFALLRAFDEAQHFAHRDRIGGARQQIAAFGAAARFHEAALLQAGQNQFQKFLGNLLAARDVGDSDRLARALRWPGRRSPAARIRL